MMKLEERRANHVEQVCIALNMGGHSAIGVLVDDIHIPQKLVKQYQHAEERDAGTEHFHLKLV